MSRAAALFLALAAAEVGRAATAYVSDELVLGVYAQQDTQGPRLATLHSGAVVETLGGNADSTQVRLADGTTGWVKSIYLTANPPATVRLRQLQDELDRNRPGMLTAEPDARAADARLRRAPAQRPAYSPASLAQRPGVWAVTVGLAAVAGFWLGYATLARRIKTKFGGIKVY